MSELSQEAFVQEAMAYLDFSSSNRTLAEEIAADAFKRALKAETEQAKRPRQLLLKQKVILATRACIRHDYTAYDDILIENPNEQQVCPVINEQEGDAPNIHPNEVDDFIKRHRR
ncbi:MAG: DUF2293 domain-containing protein [Deltaproteobacteria bacterium]|nr:DUF2293 domain-containing protein [Deltaproteobacteria bacterium]